MDRDDPPARSESASPWLVAAVVFGLLVGIAILPRLGRSSSRLVGQPAPDFAIEVVSGGEPGSRIRLEDLRGQAVVLDFWATWCGPCQAQAPVLERFSRRLRDRGLVVVGVATSDGREAAKRFSAQKRLSYPIGYDDGEQVARLYGVTTLPTIVVVDRQGKVVAVRSGFEGESDLDEMTAPAL